MEISKTPIRLGLFNIRNGLTTLTGSKCLVRETGHLDPWHKGMIAEVHFYKPPSSGTKAEEKVKTAGNLFGDKESNKYVQQVACRVAAEFCSDLRVYLMRVPVLVRLTSI